MTLSKWIEDYCAENNITLPEDIPDEKTALMFISAASNGGGGSGDSDFSSAILTLVADDDLANFYIPIFADNPVMTGSTTTVIFVGENPVILYKGVCIIGPFIDGLDSDISISGNAEWVTIGETPFLKVTGDCTITYTPNT